MLALVISLSLVGAALLASKGRDTRPPKRAPRARPTATPRSPPGVVPSPVEGVVPSPVEGVGAKNSGVRFTDEMISGLGRLRRALPDSVPLVITDGRRTAWDQAQLLFGQQQDEGWGALYDLYYRDDIIRSLQEAGPPSVETWARVLRVLAKNGVFLSAHQVGTAADVRTRDLDEGQKRQIFQAAWSLGFDPLDEGDHIHLEHLGP